MVDKQLLPLLSVSLTHLKESIFGVLHFVDNSTIASRGEPDYDRLAKVRPVIKSVKKSFIDSYKPHRENAIDEAMIKFKGRSSIKQYLPMKPVKRRFKVWVRADSLNGYICDLNAYTGKEDAPQQNLGANVVRKLSETLIGGNYHLYFNNFSLLYSFSRPSLTMACTHVVPSEKIENGFHTRSLVRN